jgi:hypothetical protein
LTARRYVGATGKDVKEQLAIIEGCYRGGGGKKKQSKEQKPKSEKKEKAVKSEDVVEMEAEQLTSAAAPASSDRPAPPVEAIDPSKLCPIILKLADGEVREYTANGELSLGSLLLRLSPSP